MTFEYELSTPRESLYNITNQVKESVSKSAVKNGIAVVFCVHTTAGITINENADPDVIHDIILGLRNVYPELPGFRHGEGNSTAHLKASTIGNSETLIIKDGRIILGTWQGIFFCEFDPPRNRKFFVKVLGEAND